MQLEHAIPRWEQDRIDRLKLDPYNSRKCSAIVTHAAEMMRWKLTDDLTPPACVEWLRRLGSEGKSPATLRNRMSAVRGLGLWLVQVGEWRENPLGSVQTPRVRMADRGPGARAFSVDEVRRLIAAAEAMEARHGCAARWGALRSTLYTTLFETGLRYSEAMRLRVCDVDLESGTLTVNGDKAGRGDRLPISRGMCDLLAEWIADRELSGTDPVFRKVSHRSLTADMRRAGIPRRVNGQGGQWHCFRKGLITHHLRRGVELKIVQRLARHQSAKTTLDHYYQLDDGALRAAVGDGTLG